MFVQEHMSEPIYGSTMGLSSRQILQKHKFLQPQWLAPVKTDISPSQTSMKNLTHEELMEDIDVEGGINGRNEDFQDHSRYNLDRPRPNDTSSNPFSKRIQENKELKLDQSNGLSRRLSSSDLNLSSPTRELPFSNIANSMSNRIMTESERRYGQRHINEDPNPSWRKRRCQDEYSRMSDVTIQNNRITDDMGRPRNKSSKNQLPFLIGNDSDNFAVEHIRKLENATRHHIHSEGLPVSNVPTPFDHFRALPPDRLNQSMVVDRDDRNHSKMHSNGDSSINGLMMVPSADLMPRNTDERSISFQTYRKERQTTVVERRKFMRDQSTSQAGDYSSQNVSLQMDQRKICPPSNFQALRPPPMISLKHRNHELSNQNTALSFQDDFSTFIRCKETLVDSTVWLQKVTFDRKKKLEKIDRIFEKFVPAMRTTEISKDFIINLISIHKRKTDEEKYSNDKSRKGHLLKLTMSDDANVETEAMRLSIDQVSSHFESVEEAFIKFAQSNNVFQQLSKSDQTQLLARNSLLFVQVIFHLIKLRILS